MSKETTPADEKLSLVEKISAFVAIHILYAIVCFIVLSIAFAPVYFKAQVLAAYIAFAVWSGCSFRCHLKYGSPWRRFSEGYPAFHTVRSYLRLSFDPLPKELIEAAKKDEAQFIFAAFPHGCSSEFRVLMEGMLQNVLPNNLHLKLRALAASVLFRIPIVREVALWTGCVDANRKTAERNLDHGNSLVVLPGGEAEQLMTEYGKERVYLRSRKGFVKLAMRKRVPVVPMYVFGSSDLFYTSRLLYGPRHFLMKRFGVCIPLCWGLGGSPICPLPDKRCTIVFGKPLIFDMKGDAPTDEELDSAHEKFMRELTMLFDSHKAQYGYKDRSLDIS